MPCSVATCPPCAAPPASRNFFITVRDGSCHGAVFRKVPADACSKHRDSAGSRPTNRWLPRSLLITHHAHVNYRVDPVCACHRKNRALPLCRHPEPQSAVDISCAPRRSFKRTQICSMNRTLSVRSTLCRAGRNGTVRRRPAPRVGRGLGDLGFRRRAVTGLGGAGSRIGLVLGSRGCGTGTA